MDGRKDCKKVSSEKDMQKRRQLLEDGQAERGRREDRSKNLRMKNRSFWGGGARVVNFFKDI
jgi:hypothetical protein